MDKSELILWQYENIKDIYLSSFQRLVTIATLINSGGILLNVTVLSGSNSNLSSYPISLCNFSFFPFKWGLISFILALALNFYILFADLQYLSFELKRTYFALSKQGEITVNSDFERVDKSLWRVGRFSILLMGLGVILSLMPVILT
nr:hypothetical protein [Legionella jordanis]